MGQNKILKRLQYKQQRLESYTTSSRKIIRIREIFFNDLIAPSLSQKMKALFKE